MDMDESDTPIKARRVICIGVPVQLIDKTLAKRHFRQFGRVLRILLRPKSQSCIVEYDCTENAQKAILKGGEYMGKTFEVTWYDKPVTKRKTKKDPDPDWTPDPEVQEELHAMAALGGGDYKKTYNLRPEGMAVDLIPTKRPVSKIKKTLKKNYKVVNPKLKSKIAPRTSSNVWTPEQLELLNTLKQPAFTIEEKHKILEARDKLIRLRMKKHTDLKKATHTVGTCPDMCPERERLMREIQHQVALYEQDMTGRGMNPILAIKQYSRSSADQEVPLPHELRSVSVLQLTMGYLMHRILNLCDTPDVNLGEWFHFLWDRTRGIRKDITQQELCCQGSVALIEQCARFHIHCSARLVAEDPSVFDQKINTENLTKCLQTLKYMYHDLRLKDESCPNEAEFRAYIILLNLNDGNFMWEVQQLKLEIQKSPEVKFALEVYSAINKNNFVKFFKLVSSTGYLNACILLRYFVQVRTRALSTIVKCYSPRMPYTHFPLSELENLLAFEDLTSTVDFIVSYGLYLNPDETQVILDRKSYQMPEIPYTLDRAIKIVESKRKATVGEIVCGGFLPPPDFENYVPHNSFDENGLFRITGVLVNIIKEAEHETVSSTNVPVSVDQPDLAKDEVKVPSLPSIPVTSSGNIFQKAPSVQSSSTNIFSTKIPALVEDKPTDPSQPFWSIKSEPKTNTGNIFKKRADSPSGLGIFGVQQPKGVETFKQPAFGEQQKLNIFGEQKQPKPSIFGEQQQTTNIFVDQQQKPNNFGKQKQKMSIFIEQQQPKNTFEEQQKSIGFGESQFGSIFKDVKKQGESTIPPNIFGVGFKPSQSIKTDENAGFVTRKPFSVGDTKLNSGTQQNVFNTDKISSNVFRVPHETSVQEIKPVSGIAAGQSYTNIFNRVNAGQPVVPQTLPSITPFLPISRSPIKSQQDKEHAEKLKLEEEEKERRLLKEKEEKLRREIKEVQQKAELRKRQIEEEKRRKERERLEKERQKFEEEKRIAMLIEKERKLKLEIKQSVTELMDELLTKVEAIHKQERLKEIAGGIRKHKTLLFTQKWRRKIAINKRKRQAMDQNPVWLSSRTADEEAQELLTDTQSLALQNIKRYKYGRSFELPIPPKIQYERMNVRHIYKILVNSYYKICIRPQKEIFWKVTVSLPDFHELKLGLNLIESVLMDFFQWKDRYGSTAVVDQYKADKRFTYSVEKKLGANLVENNSNGLLFISHEPTELLFQRITKSLKNFPNLARIPMAVILVNNNTSGLNAQNLGKVLESDRHVTNYDILACKFTNAALVNAVKQSLDFLATFVDKPPPLELDMLQSFLHVHLVTELWKRVSSYAAWNSKYKACLKSSSLVINLYNDAVEKLKAIMLDKCCLEYSDFPDEFDKLVMDQTPEVLPCDYRYFPPFWKTDSYRCLLMNAMNSVKLPKFHGNWPPENEADLEQDIFVYCSEIFKNPETVFYKVMAIILRNVDPNEDFDKVKNVLWTDVIEVLASEKLRETNFHLNHTEFHSKSIFQQLFVVYDVKSLEKYNSDEWFYLKNPLVEAEIRFNSQNKPAKEKEEMQVEFLDDFDLDELEESLRTDTQVTCKKTEIKELQNFMADLEESMEIHKKINSNFQRTVKMALNLNK